MYDNEINRWARTVLQLRFQQQRHISHYNPLDETSRSHSFSSNIIGPIPWGHSGPLCHALSLSSWTSMRRRCATVPITTSGELAWGGLQWWMGPTFFKCFLFFHVLFSCLSDHIFIHNQTGCHIFQAVQKPAISTINTTTGYGLDLSYLTIIPSWTVAC